MLNKIKKFFLSLAPPSQEQLDSVLAAFDLVNQVEYLKSVGGGFTFFSAKDTTHQKEFWSVMSHHEGPSGPCRMAHGDTLAEAVARLKLAVANSDRQKAKSYVN